MQPIASAVEDVPDMSQVPSGMLGWASNVRNGLVNGSMWASIDRGFGGGGIAHQEIEIAAMRSLRDMIDVKT